MKLLALYSISLIMLGCYSKKPERTGNEGKPLPSFNLLLTDSSTIFDTKNIPNGTPAVLICFSPSCTYSRAQVQEIINDIKEIKEINFYLFTSMPFGSMKKFYEDYNLKKYSNIICGMDYSQYFKSYFQVKGFPYIAIYGKDRKLKQALFGQTNVKYIKETAEN